MSYFCKFNFIKPKNTSFKRSVLFVCLFLYLFHEKFSIVDSNRFKKTDINVYVHNFDHDPVLKNIRIKPLN